MTDETSLIYIDPESEITEVIDQMRKHPTAAVRLVIPKGSVVLQSLVSLKLLKRAAHAEQKDLAVVISDPVGQHLAEQVGLTTYLRPKDQTPIFTDGPEAAVDESDEKTVLTTDDQPLKPVFQRQPLARDDDQPDSQPLSIDPAEADQSVPAAISVHRYDQTNSQVTKDDSRREGAEQLIRRGSRRRGGSQPSPNFFRFLQRFLLLGGLLIAGAIVFMEIVPRSTMIVTLATEPFEQTITVTASGQITAIDTANASIPGVNETAGITAEQTAPATGTKQIGERSAATVTLSNYWDANPQAFPLGTVLLTTNQIRFVTTAAMTIPGASTTLREGRVVTTPGTVNTTIQAESAGQEANGATGRLTIPSLPIVRQDRIYGDFVAASAGGTSQEVTVVTQADVDTLKKSGQTALLEAAQAVLTEQLAGSPRRMLDGAITVSETEAVISAAVGDQAESITYQATARAAALSFTDQDLKDAALAILQELVPSGKKIVMTETSQLIAATKTVDPVNQQLVIEAQIKTQIGLEIDPNSLADTAAGQSATEARAALLQVPGVADVAITLRPRWIRRLPRRPSQLTVSLIYATPAAVDQASESVPSEIDQ